MISTPYIPFEPAWKVQAGPLENHGKGLLSLPLEQRCLIDSFTLCLGSFNINVRPKQGQIWLDAKQVLQLEAAAKLIWARTMQKELSSGLDKNTASFKCLFYKVGLEDSKGAKHGWRIYEDGRMLKGIT